MFVIYQINFKIRSHNIKQSLNNPVEKIASENEMKSKIIDKTEDNESLGFPPQRKIAIDSKGNIYVVYRKKYQGFYEIFVAKGIQIKGQMKFEYSDRPISPILSDVSQRVASIAIDSKDIIHVVWYGSNSLYTPDCRQIKYSKSEDESKSWTKWKDIAEVSSYSGQDSWQEHPYIYIGYKDEVFIVWEGKDGKNKKQQIKFIKSLDSGNSWTKWINVKPTSIQTQSRPVILQDSKGDLHIVMYSTFFGSINQIQYSKSEDSGNSWSNWQTISGVYQDSRHLSAVINSEDVVHVVWRQGKIFKPAAINYAKKTGEVWSEPKIISSSTFNQYFPNISLDNNNNPIIFWMESTKSYDYPNEQPQDGKIYSITLVDDKNISAKLESKGDKNLYPNLPINFNKEKNIIFIYLKKDASDSQKSINIIVK